MPVLHKAVTVVQPEIKNILRTLLNNILPDYHEEYKTEVLDYSICFWFHSRNHRLLDESVTQTLRGYRSNIFNDRKNCNCNIYFDKVNWESKVEGFNEYVRIEDYCESTVKEFGVRFKLFISMILVLLNKLS